jgi:hypothetical protein
MNAKVIFLSHKFNALNNFLSKFYSKDLRIANSLSWHKYFNNPVDISELIAVFIDNIDSDELHMCISLDKDVFIKVTPSNANNIIKYLFERYPY